MSAGPPSVLRERRLLGGWSQDQLARHVGVSRQALNALERGHAQPSVETAFALATFLGTTVEALFGTKQRAPLPMPTRVGPVGTRLLLAEVAGHVRTHRLDPSSGEPADAVVEDSRQPPTLLENDRWRRTLLVAGCDPALRMLALRTGNARWLNAGTGKAVNLLVRRQVHVVGVHSLTERDRRRVRGTLLVHLATWPLGLAVRKGNPRGIRGIADLARADVRFVNREVGASARALLDRRLMDLGLAPAMVQGYDDQAHSHEAVAQAVAFGSADVGVTTAAAASTYELELRQLSEESFDLVVRPDELSRPEVQGLLAVARTPAFHRDVGALPGYGTARSGQPVGPT
ncbi:MAG TPA: substrate-binding domain-containing protein [Myxococcaceae bacterium]|jgi:molybdate-binding protein/DNA-binding XRE family transcriptional regulator